MRKYYTFLMALFFMLSIISACSPAKEDIQVNDVLDLSKASVKLEIQGANMTKDFGIYGEVDNALGIIVYGHVEKGKIQENYNIPFVDEDGKVLYINNLFRVEIVLKKTSNEYSTKRQSYAESGDDILLYLKYDEDDVLANTSKYEGILDSINKCKFVILE